MTSADGMTLPNNVTTQQLRQCSGAHGAVRPGVCLTDGGVANIQLPTALLRSMDPKTVDWVVVTVHFMMAYGRAKVKLLSLLTLIRY